MNLRSDWRLVTGGTGLLGRYVVAELVRLGYPVRLLVRKTSNLELIAEATKDGTVEQFVGDLSDPQSLDGILSGVSHVYHCAARLGDWGPWSEFERGIVETTRHLVDQAISCELKRFVHVSSLAAYGHIRAPGPWTESQPLGQNLWWWDYYARAKMLAEQEVYRLSDRFTVVRPTWIYGRGDSTILPRIVRALQQGKVTLLGDGTNLMNMVHAQDVAVGMVLAGQAESSRGRAYNLCSAGEMTQREFFGLLVNHLALPPVSKSAPLWAAHQFGFLNECWARMTHQQKPPRVTRHGISLLTRPVQFSSQAAESEFGWRRTRSLQQSLPEALDGLIVLSSAGDIGRPVR